MKIGKVNTPEKSLTVYRNTRRHVPGGLVLLDEIFFVRSVLYPQTEAQQTELASIIVGKWRGFFFNGDIDAWIEMNPRTILC